MDTQGPEAGQHLINPAASGAYNELAALFFPPADTDPTPKPPAGPYDDYDGDSNA